MVDKKLPAGGGMAALVREASRKAKLYQTAKEQAETNGTELVFDAPVQPVQPKIFNILEFIEQPWGLNHKLYPAQRFLVKLYYNLPLDNTIRDIQIRNPLQPGPGYMFTEQEYLKFLYEEGRCNIGVQDHMRRELVLAIGRRAGKTTLSGIFASYEIYKLLNLGNPQAYYGLPNGNIIQVISIATDKEQASILFNEVASHVVKCEYFKPYSASNTQSKLMFRTPYDIERYGASNRANGKFVSLNGKATIRVAFKGCTGKGVRGFGNAVVIMDEMAHYLDEGKASAKDIYDAITPSTAAYSPKDPKEPSKPIGPVESRIITISSPLNKTGQFYELYHRAMSGMAGSENMLAIQAPTWEINTTLPDDYYQQRYHADPTVFMTEHGAQFSDRVRGWIEREADLYACVDPDLRPQLVGFPRHPHSMGIDIGLVGDATAIVITTQINGKVVLVYHEVWKAGVPWRESNPHLLQPLMDYAKTLETVTQLDFDVIGEWIQKLTKLFYITDGIFDRWNGIPLEQRLLKMGLTQFKCEMFPRDLSSRIYQNAKMLMFDKSLVLYDFPASKGNKRSPLLDELLKLQATQVSKNVVVVEAPKAPGFHDDMADAYVRSVWLTAERMRNEKHVFGAAGGPNPYAGSRINANTYQRTRMRSHGVVTERMDPRKSVGRGMRSRWVRGR